MQTGFNGIKYISMQIGPNVSIGSGVIIGPGARVKDAIILDKAEIKV